MTWTLLPLDRAAAIEIASWQYEPPYDVYNMSPQPGDGTIEALIDPRLAYHGLYNAEGRLDAFCCFGLDARVPGGDYKQDALDVGLGLRPDLTGRGQGIHAARAALDHARQTCAPRAFRVTIAAFNTRAQRVWAKLGFQAVSLFEAKRDGRPFVIWVADSDAGTWQEDERAFVGLSEQNLILRPAMLDDAARAADMLNQCAVEETGEPRYQAANLRTDWQRPSFDLNRDSRIAIAPDGRVVGLAVVFDPEPHEHILAGVDVVPDARGQGIGTALCTWTEDRARRSLPLAPVGARVILSQEKMATNQAAAQLLTARGYRVTRHSLRMRIEMKEPPPLPVAPPGIDIRPFDRNTEGKALVRAIRKSFRGSWGYADRPFDVEYADWMHLLDRDNH